jgi:hypothetical protein
MFVWMPRINSFYWSFVHWHWKNGRDFIYSPWTQIGLTSQKHSGVWKVNLRNYGQSIKVSTHPSTPVWWALRFQEIKLQLWPIFPRPHLTRGHQLSIAGPILVYFWRRLFALSLCWPSWCASVGFSRHRQETLAGAYFLRAHEVGHILGGAVIFFWMLRTGLRPN